MYYVYVLQSNIDKNFYVGSTSDLSKRLKSHNKGKVKSTKSRRPLELIYHESLITKTIAIKREHFFKSGNGRKWLKDNVLS